MRSFRWLSAWLPIRATAARCRRTPLRYHPRLEVLETRSLLSSFTVDTPGDGAGHTLRRAILDSNASNDLNNTILFSGTAAGGTIVLASALPAIVHSLTIVGPGAGLLAVSGNFANRVFWIDTAGITVNIAGLSIINGSVTGEHGGGILLSRESTLNLVNCVISNNRANNGNGGGIAVETPSLGSLTLTNCLVSNNEASLNGGGIDSAGADITVMNSTFTNNVAHGDWFLDGGGGAISLGNGQAFLINSTFDRNQAPNGQGGAINSDFIATFTITNCTVASNSGFVGGGIANYSQFPLTFLSNSIVALNSADVDPNIAGYIDSRGHNLIGNATGILGGLVASDRSNVDLAATLGPLQNNGGLTPTRALLPGSPAIDAGDNSLAVDARGSRLATDHRGFNRVVNGTVDIGAYEFQPAPVITLASSQTPAIVGATVTFTATLSGLAPGSNQPAGLVTFLVDGSPISTAPLQGLTASFATATLTIGNHTVIAVFDSVPFPPTQAAPLTQVVIGQTRENNTTSQAVEHPTLSPVVVLTYETIASFHSPDATYRVAPPEERASVIEQAYSNEKAVPNNPGHNEAIEVKNPDFQVVFSAGGEDAESGPAAPVDHVATLQENGLPLVVIGNRAPERNEPSTGMTQETPAVLQSLPDRAWALIPALMLEENDRANAVESSWGLPELQRHGRFIPGPEDIILRGQFRPAASIEAPGKSSNTPSEPADKSSGERKDAGADADRSSCLPLAPAPLASSAANQPTVERILQTEDREEWTFALAAVLLGAIGSGVAYLPDRRRH